MIGCFNCPITANCRISLSNHISIKQLVKSKAANAPTTAEEMVLVMILLQEKTATPPP